MNTALALLFILQLYLIQLDVTIGSSMSTDSDSHSKEDKMESKSDASSMICKTSEYRATQQEAIEFFDNVSRLWNYVGEKLPPFYELKASADLTFTDLEKKLQRNRRQLSSIKNEGKNHEEKIKLNKKKKGLAAKIITTINLRSKTEESINILLKIQEDLTNLLATSGQLQTKMEQLNKASVFTSITNSVNAYS
uniref:Hypotheticial protein n=1 Tax=Schistosoma japonicum TaxID=6182 RepID=C1LFE6_SCHJA|nr:hypotheticial protein [Schistosoma japonicum]